MRQSKRKTILYLSLFLFPITMNFLSPYVSIDGRWRACSPQYAGVIALFLSGLFLGRAWCGWVARRGRCRTQPWRQRQTRQPQAPPHRAVFHLRVRFSVIVLGFVLAGGVKGIDPLRMTERAFPWTSRSSTLFTTLCCCSSLFSTLRWKTRRLPRDLLDVPVLTADVAGAKTAFAAAADQGENRSLHRLQKMHAEVPNEHRRQHGSQTGRGALL